MAKSILHYRRLTLFVQGPYYSPAIAFLFFLVVASFPFVISSFQELLLAIFYWCFVALIAFFAAPLAWVTRFFPTAMEFIPRRFFLLSSLMAGTVLWGILSVFFLGHS